MKEQHLTSGFTPVLALLCDSCVSSPPHYILHNNHINNINTCAHSARLSQLIEKSTLCVNVAYDSAKHTS